MPDSCGERWTPSELKRYMLRFCHVSNSVNSGLFPSAGPRFVHGKKAGQGALSGTLPCCQTVLGKGICHPSQNSMASMSGRACYQSLVKGAVLVQPALGPARSRSTAITVLELSLTPESLITT